VNFAEVKQSTNYFASYHFAIYVFNPLAILTGKTIFKIFNNHLAQ